MRKPSDVPPWEALLVALREQTTALTRLAASNEALVDAMLAEEEEEEGQGSAHL